MENFKFFIKKRNKTKHLNSLTTRDFQTYSERKKTNFKYRASLYVFSFKGLYK